MKVILYLCIDLTSITEMKKETITGFAYGLLSSSTFGLIPLFTLPVIAEGMQFPSILLYRFILACIILATLLVVSGISLKLNLKDLPKLLLLAVFYDISSLFLFWGYHLISSGVATAIHFMYPVFTTLLMMVFFKEKKSIWRIFAIILAIIGVALLSISRGNNTQLSLSGIIIVLISGLGYASYLVAVNKINIQMNGLKLTFYVFLLGGIILFTGISLFSEVQPIPSWKSFTSLALLAIIPTIISNLALIQAIKRIGSTITSVLGAMEPVTAILVGLLLFSEVFTLQIGFGIALIIGAVLIIILKN